MNPLLLPVIVGLALLTPGAWVLVQLLSQGGRVLLRIEGLEARLADGAARRTTQPTAAAISSTGGPFTVPTSAVEIASRNNGIPLPVAEHVATKPVTASLPAAPAPQTSKGYCGKGPAPVPLPIGETAPSLILPDLAGVMVDLAGFRSTRTLVLFWHPGCGYCRRMLDALKAWEADPPEEAPRLLVVSMGSTDANVALGLRSTVVLDRGFVVPRAFGASGTPSAVLVDEHGRIASRVARGAPAVLSLAGAPALGEPMTASASV